MKTFPRTNVKARRLAVKENQPELYKEWRRFFNQVKLVNGCWQWNGQISSQYPVLTIFLKRKQVIQHVLYYLLFGRFVSSRFVHIRMKCENKACVRPSHIRFYKLEEIIQHERKQHYARH